MNQHVEPIVSLCVLIPCFNHGSLIEQVISGLSVYQLPCIIVDDGSDDETKQVLTKLIEINDWLTLITLPHNSGKGGAVIAGFKEAFKQGYSHCLQIDADAQHNIDDIPQLIANAHKYPQALISGQPTYDETVPKSRLYSRYITHVWVWIETLSFTIKDSMCGFRVYPLAAVMPLLQKKSLGQYMDFDIDIMVRLYWEGTECYFFPTKVVYPKDGVSHFSVWKDNLRISWMHTRLFFGMFPHVPALLKRHFKKDTHWSEISERKGLWGMRFLLAVYRLFGRRLCYILLYPIASYFWLTGKKQREASQQYLALLRGYASEKGLVLPQHLNSYKHFLRFAQASLDKVAAWLNQIPAEQINFPNKSHCLDLVKQKQGCLLLVSHLGDIELCRALAELSDHVIINAFVFTKHALRFNQLVKEINPKSTINLIQVDEVGMDTTILLEEKLKAGEWVAIVGDRTPVTTYHRDTMQSRVWVSFLGKKAPFPKGPFTLALLLKYPVYLMFCLKKQEQFYIDFKEFNVPQSIKRNERPQQIAMLAQRYADELANHCIEAPLDWFNFYDFWQDNGLEKLSKD